MPDRYVRIKPRVMLKAGELDKVSIAQDLGAKIAEVRKARGVTSEDLAAKIGVTRGTLSVWENGRGIPDAYAVAVIAHELGTSFGEFFEPDTLPARDFTEERLAQQRAEAATPTTPPAGASDLPESEPDAVELAQLRADLEATRLELADLNDRFATAMELIAPRLATSADADAQLRRAIQRRAS